MIIGIPSIPQPAAAPDHRARNALAGSASFAVISLALIANNGARATIASVVAVLVSLAVPLGWIAFRRQRSVNAFLVTTISFNAYCMLAFDALLIVSGAMLVGIRYFLPISLLQTASAIMLIAAHRLSLGGRAQSLAGFACAFVAFVLESVFLIRFH